MTVVHIQNFNILTIRFTIPNPTTHYIQYVLSCDSHFSVLLPVIVRKHALFVESVHINVAIDSAYLACTTRLLNYALNIRTTSIICQPKILTILRKLSPIVIVLIVIQIRIDTKLFTTSSFKSIKELFCILSTQCLGNLNTGFSPCIIFKVCKNPGISWVKTSSFHISNTSICILSDCCTIYINEMIHTKNRNTCSLSFFNILNKLAVNSSSITFPKDAELNAISFYFIEVD